MKKQGLIVFDDFNQAFPGVIKAVKENIIHSKKFQVLFVVDDLLVAKKLSSK
ncbi:MAG: hypothetical protein GF390_01050 [Candidatus Pacebacteria bacterium]|nr:hypothetical protein [Candidatus Paceibacterota bacterium]